MQMTLYLAPGSSSMAPHIALNEIGAPFATHALSLPANQTRTDAFLAINPEGKVPSLLVDGQLITEVAGVMFFLAKQFPDAKLLPSDAQAQAQVVSWMSFIASSVHPAMRQGVEHARTIYQLADQRLGAKPFAVGAAYSIADIHLFRLFWRNKAALNAAPGEFANLEAHYAMMMQRPAVTKTIAIEDELKAKLPTS